MNKEQVRIITIHEIISWKWNHYHLSCGGIIYPGGKVDNHGNIELIVSSAVIDYEPTEDESHILRVICKDCELGEVQYTHCCGG